MADDFADFIEDSATKPTDIESVLYLFWDKGIDYNQFIELPIPYIISVLRAHSYVKNKEKEAIKDASRKH